MSRSEEFSNGSGKIPSHLADYEFHGTSKENRASIEKHGLKAHLAINESGVGNASTPGVWHAGPEEAAGYAGPDGDIYAVDIRGYDSDMDASGYWYTPHSIPADRVQRVAHTDGYGSIHWHKEEDCPNG
jgi:hypothetical protein